ncbi:hypothetical protein TNCV_797151 [Trichonephila clavipes]|uniref:Uncharacterized protein n=1 Tax=Trichonephila clavipes TaxID=2585209 RepID=A0A8X6WKB1_TRICX|nr:hypothetical protein TNCV_2083031 [Trichonephila clavipes]GFY35366.1 hypothetical protein TNCV_797151 [Trichonephila clavipes]
MEGKSRVWDEDDLEAAGENSEIFGLGGDESGGKVQSVEECPTDAHLEQVSCPQQEVCECPNLWHLRQRKGFGM